MRRYEMMLNMIQNIRITGARLAALLVLVALLGAGVQAAMATEQTLTMSIASNLNEKNRTDPTLSSTSFPGIGGFQQYHLYTHFSPLIAQDSDGKVIPWMAESYEVSDDAKTITFHLRKGVEFADGTPLNASVMKFNFDRIITYGWTDTFGSKPLNYASALFVYYDHSEAPDEYTFKIYFSKGIPGMTQEMTWAGNIYGIYISPLDVDPAWDIKGKLKPEKIQNGLGPYYLDENESIPKEKFVLKRRNSWRDDLNFHKPKLDKIVLAYIADSQVAELALKKGEIDYINRKWNAPLDSLPNLESDSKITIKSRPDTWMYFIRTAHWKEPFNGTDGILLRKAINYALNKTEMVEGAFNGYALPAEDSMFFSPIKQGVPDCCHIGYKYDPDKAKQLLAQAGWNDTDGDGILDKNGKPLKIELLVTSLASLAWMKDLSVVVQAQLKRLGVDVQIQTLEWAEYKTKVKDGKYDIQLDYYQGRTMPQNMQVNSFTIRDSAKSAYGNENGTLARLAESAKYSVSEKEWQENICQICRILYDEAGIIPMVYPKEYAVMSNRLKGFEFGADPIYDHVEECWIED